MGVSWRCGGRRTALETSWQALIEWLTECGISPLQGLIGCDQRRGQRHPRGGAVGVAACRAAAVCVAHSGAGGGGCGCCAWGPCAGGGADCRAGRAASSCTMWSARKPKHEHSSDLTQFVVNSTGERLGRRRSFVPLTKRPNTCGRPDYSERTDSPSGRSSSYAGGPRRWTGSRARMVQLTLLSRLASLEEPAAWR